MSLQILLLCHRVPFPLSDGGALVTHNLIKGLANYGARIDVLSYNTSKHFVASNIIKNEFSFVQNFSTVYLNNEVAISGAIKNLFSNRSYHIARFETLDFEHLLRKLLQNNFYDIVIIDHVFLKYYLTIIRQYSKAKLYCRLHNLEYLIWEKVALQSNIFKKIYLQIQSKRLKKEELSALQQMDELLLLNPNEDKILKQQEINTKTYYLPYSIPTLELSPVENYLPNSIFHLASMNWIPNVEALDWFLEKVWPLIKAKNREIKFHIGGLHLPEKYLVIADPQIVVHPVVESASTFMKNFGVQIIPLQSGAGVRIKVLQGMALGIPMVSTNLGADGIPVKNQEHIYLANDPLDFADKILLLSDGKSKIGATAHQLLKSNFSSEQVFPAFINYLQNA